MKPAAILEAPSVNGRDETGEIWLRSNLRPVLWLAALATLLALAVIVTTLIAVSMFAALIAGGLCLTAGCGIAALAVAAARPRLERRGGRLRIRLSPTGAEDVPLEVVECFFQGSNPIARSGEATCGEHAAFRVNTLVMRLAERADALSKRTTFTPWGTWDDGYVVFDGRWCEPLSADFARGIGRRLVESKRSLSEREPSADQPRPNQSCPEQACPERASPEQACVDQTSAGGRA